MTSPRGDPWRLGCPHCRSVDWRWRNAGYYVCMCCERTFARLLDKKTGKEAEA